MGIRRYDLAGKTVEWTWNEREPDIARMGANNLRILDRFGQEIWNMRDMLAADDICVDLKIVDDSEIRFITLHGWSVAFDVGEMKALSRRIVK